MSKPHTYSFQELMGMPMEELKELAVLMREIRRNDFYGKDPELAAVTTRVNAVYHGRQTYYATPKRQQPVTQNPDPDPNPPPE